MKKALVIPLTDEDLLELCRIIIDQDKEAALQFIEQHLKKKANEALEGG
ncbi:MAG: hypothetical protein NUW24_14095 [Anaerolineae bacterium]|jgi:hypothetical protein|nr:hypothetical protein [Anaerolineae bacterium]MDH7474957.1 hypothetical protein [Anaerolineae bacterium]